MESHEIFLSVLLLEAEKLSYWLYLVAAYFQVYVIPLVQSLLGRIIPRIRALIIVPSRDLALQVKSVFDVYTDGTDIRVAALCGGISESYNDLTYYDDYSWFRIAFYVFIIRHGKQRRRHHSKLRAGRHHHHHSRQTRWTHQKQPEFWHSRPPIPRRRWGRQASPPILRQLDPSGRNPISPRFIALQSSQRNSHVFFCERRRLRDSFEFESNFERKRLSTSDPGPAQDSFERHVE